jgi:hypothetical protein
MSKTQSSPKLKVQEIGSPKGDFIRVWVEDKHCDLDYEEADRVYHFLMYYLKSNAKAVQ